MGDQTTFFIALGIILGAGVVSGLAGFGFGLVAVPPLLALYDPARVVVIVNLLAVVTAWVILRGQWDRIQLRTLGLTVPSAYVGIPAGLLVLKLADPTLLKLIASVVSGGFAIFLLSGYKLRGIESSLASVLAGFTSGTLSSSTGLSGPPVVVLFSAREVEPVTFRVSLTAYFVLTNVVALVLLALGREMHVSDLVLSLFLMPAAIVGRSGGRWLAARTSPERFRRITLLLLLLTGISGLVTALLALSG